MEKWSCIHPKLRSQRQQQQDNLQRRSRTYTTTSPRRTNLQFLRLWSLMERKVAHDYRIRLWKLERVWIMSVSGSWTQTLEQLNANRDASSQLGIGLRKNTASALLNNHCKFHVREGYYRHTHIRGDTEVLEGGKVRVHPIATKTY